MTRTVQYFLKANSTNWHKIIVFLMFRPMVCGTHVLTTWNKINGQCYSAQATCHKIVARRSNAKASWMPFLWVTGHPSERISNTQFFLEIRMVCCAIECGWDWIKPPFFPWKYESSVLGLLKTVQHFPNLTMLEWFLRYRWRSGEPADGCSHMALAKFSEAVARFLSCLHIADFIISRLHILVCRNWLSQSLAFVFIVSEQNDVFTHMNMFVMASMVLS